MEGSDVGTTRAATERALIQERRRIAADVHDLVMQDLALALASARALADEPDVHGRPDAYRQASIVIAAGERALLGARQLLGDLSAMERKPVVEAVEDSVRAAARSTPLNFDASSVPPGVQPDPPTLHALIHIGREAVTNAAKYADPTAIEVLLERDDEWRLRIRDDGRGYDALRREDTRPGRSSLGQSGPRQSGPGQSAHAWTGGPDPLLGTDDCPDPLPGGFGLESMRQCAHALGGSLLLISAPQGGTTVEAVLP
jgi:signal transduction histidine kinase